MILDRKEGELYFSLYWIILFSYNKKHNIVKNVPDVDSMKKIPHEKWVEIRDKVFSDVTFIYDFIQEKSQNLLKEELDVLNNWAKFFVKGDFIIVTHTKESAIFMDVKDNKKLYSVFGLTTHLEKIFPKEQLPALVNGVLLPFNNKIVYDGLLTQSHIRFGHGIISNIKENYRINKAKYGLIENLVQKTKKKEDVEKLLTEYLKHPKAYNDEIYDLISESEENEILYYHLISKKYLRAYKKQIKEIRINDKLFVAMYLSIVIQTGTNEQELKENLNKIISNDKLKFVYIGKI